VVSDQHELAQAFAAFSRISAELEGSYAQLETRVAALHDELSAAREERTREIEAKELLAERLKNILEVLPGGVVVLDGAQVVRQHNPAAADLLGLPLLGETWTDICARAFRNASRFGGEVTLRSGRQVSISQRALGAASATEGAGQIILITDLTEASLVRDLLERHKRLSAIGEMAATLAHQIRTPLSAALLYASQMSSPNLAPHAQLRFAERTSKCLRDLERLVNDMLAFARGGGGMVETFSLSALLEQVAQCLEPKLAGGARLTIRTLAPELKLRGNSHTLAGALLNLATNAFENGSDVHVLIEARNAGPGCAEIRVADDGPGVPEHLRERIFEPFFTTRERGTGLGLAVVKSVVTAHGGEVELLSREPHGAEFLIRLPLAGAPPVIPLSPTRLAQAS
jgi:two-component system sensor histidine kinase FlrB